jgi:bilin biosynthesis protein
MLFVFFDASVSTKTFIHKNNIHGYILRKPEKGATMPAKEPKPTLDALLEELADTNAAVRKQALFRIKRHYRAQALGPIMAALKDEQADVRVQAANALAVLGDPRAIPALIALCADKSASVRRAAVGALKTITNSPMSGSINDIQPLIGLISDKSLQVRTLAASVLGALGNTQAIPALVARLPLARDGEFQAVTEALARLRDRQMYTRRIS